MVEAERVTEPGLAAVSGSGESRGFEGREPEPSPDSWGQLAAVAAVTSAAALVSKAWLWPGQPIDVRWTQGH